MYLKDFHRFAYFVWIFVDLVSYCFKTVRYDLLPIKKTSARFQASFLSSEDLHRFHRSSCIFRISMDFRGSGVIMFQIGQLRFATPIETLARFQVGFLSSDLVF